jgi:hypothetical protein
MDSDTWVGIIGLAVLVPIGLFNWYALIPGRAKKPPSRGVRAFMALLGGACIAAGTDLVVRGVFISRHEVTLTVLSTSGQGGNYSERYIETSAGTYEDASGDFSNEAVVGRRYRCRVTSGYTGSPKPFTTQADLESCRPES